MRFTSATAAEMALLLAAVSAAVVWLFFLKLRHPRVLVPSLVLWQHLLRRERPDSLWDRIRRAVSLALALAIALLVAAALGSPRPRLPGDSGDRPVTAIVDISPTMGTRMAGGGTRLARAIEQARAIVARAGDGRFEILTSSGALIAPLGTDVEAGERALGRLEVSAEPCSVDALRASSIGTRLFFVTDGVSRCGTLPPDVSVVPVFEPADNIGITAFEVRPVPARPTEHEAFLEVTNFTNRPARVELAIEAGTRAIAPQVLELGPHEVYAETIAPGQLAPGPVTARLRASDALAFDNEAFAYVPDTRALRVTLVTQGSEFLATALALHPQVALTTLSPAEYFRPRRAGAGGSPPSPAPGSSGPAGSPPDLYIFDRVSPREAPGRPALLFGSMDVSWIAGVQRLPSDTAGPLAPAPSAAHPVLGGLKLQDVLVRRARAVEVDAQRAAVLASAGSHPLVVAGEQPHKWVLVGFALEDSDFATSVEFPIFLQNVLEWVRTEQAPVVRRAGRPGVSFSRRGGEVTPIVVNASDREISDVNRSIFQDQTPAAAPGPGHDVRLWLLAAALVLVSCEWLMFHRRLTV